jgi:putative transposase
MPATTYSPTHFRVQYHRPSGSCGADTLVRPAAEIVTNCMVSGHRIGSYAADGMGTSHGADRGVRATLCDSTHAMQFSANKYEYRRRLPHYQKFDRVLFVTFCTLNRWALSPRARDVVLGHCIHDHGERFVLHAVAIMPDHVHLMLTQLRDESGRPYPLAAILKSIKGTSARDINKLRGCGGPVWQEESFDHVLRTSESFEEKIEYIRQNPVRRGLVKKAEDYPWLWLGEPV